MRGDNGADDGNDVDDDDVHPSMRHVIAMMVTRSMTKSARAEFQENIHVRLFYQHPEGFVGFSDPDYLSLEVKDSRLSNPDYYHIIPVTPPDNSLSVTGELLVEIDSPFLFGNGLVELLNVAIRIQDQHFNWSNAITTPNITVNKQ